MTDRTLKRVMIAGLLLATAPVAMRGQTPLDTSRTDGLPTGQGHLSISTITVNLSDGNLQIVFIPLDERILRLVTRDSYLGIEGTVASQRRAIDSAAAIMGLSSPGIAFVSFQGLAPNTRFDPQQVTLNYHGQQFRPVAIIPMSATFSNLQLDVRQQVQAFFLYRRDIPVRESFTVSYFAATSGDWAGNLPRFDAERSRILGTVKVRGDTTGH
jgi:hypothetical protein